MKIELQLQKMNMQVAITWLTIIETCDINIATGIEVDFYREKRENAIAAYASAMESIVDTAISIANSKIQKVA